MKNKSTVGKGAVALAVIAGLMYWPVADGFGSSGCWDVRYHPKFSPTCGCDEDVMACLPVKQINKTAWDDCGSGTRYGGPCPTVSKQIGTEQTCMESLNTGGVDACLLSVGGLTVSGAGIVTPTGVTQVAGFIGAIVSLLGMYFACAYCNMVKCAAPNEGMTPIYRNVLDTKAKPYIGCYL